MRLPVHGDGVVGLIFEPCWRCREDYKKQADDLASARSRVETLAQALYEIRENDPIENCLDPQRAARIAAHVLGEDASL